MFTLIGKNILTNTHKSTKLDIEGPKEENIPSGSPEIPKGEGEDKPMDYERMAREYLTEAERIDRRLEELRRENRLHLQSDLWERIGRLMEIRDDLRVTGHVLQRRALGRSLGDRA